MIRRFSIFIFAALLAGCTTVKESHPARTATEQLILSHAVIDSARQIKADAVAGKKVRMDLTYLKPSTWSSSRASCAIACCNWALDL